MKTTHQNKTILHADLLPTDRNGIMGRCEHGKSMFENCGQCLWQEIGGEYHDDKPPWYVEEFDLTISSGGDHEEPD